MHKKNFLPFKRKLKTWPNGLASWRKFWTCIQLALVWPPTCVDLHWLVWTCVDFGWAQIWTQVATSFLLFGHPVQVNTSCLIGKKAVSCDLISTLIFTVLWNVSVDLWYRREDAEGMSYKSLYDNNTWQDDKCTRLYLPLPPPPPKKKKKITKLLYFLNGRQNQKSKPKRVKTHYRANEVHFLPGFCQSLDMILSPVWLCFVFCIFAFSSMMRSDWWTITSSCKTS